MLVESVQHRTRCGNRTRVDDDLSLFAALLLFTTPTVIALASSAYVDLALLFYSAAALIALLCWSESGRTSLLLASALAAGAAASTKYNGVLVIVLLAAGVLIGLRYLYYMFVGDAGGHVQSLILASILIGMGFQTILIGFVADLLAVNRRLLEDIRVEQRRSVLEEHSKERSDEIRIRSMPSGRKASGAD